MNAQIFREYDIRGVVDRDLNPEIVENLGKATWGRPLEVISRTLGAKRWSLPGTTVYLLNLTGTLSFPA